jgi:hypothetical protein
MRTIPALAMTGVLALGGSAAAVATMHHGAATAAPVDPAGFSHPRANPWFPLQPGTVTLLRGTDEGRHLRERVEVTRVTRTIQGVRTTVVRDVLRRHDGTLAERTVDWYAADDAGNVWYFGERTATYDRHGHLDSREGSWQAGVHGARAGLVMPADPQPTDAYRQEYWAGHAEDQAWVVARRAHVRTPLRSFGDALRTLEWSRLEPRVVSVKLYARGVGIVREHDLAGGTETFEVVSVRHVAAR